MVHEHIIVKIIEAKYVTALDLQG